MESSVRLNCCRLKGDESDGGGGIEKIGEKDQIITRGCGGGDEKRFEAGLTGQATDLLGKCPIGIDQIFRPYVQLPYIRLIGQIKDSLELDLNGG